MYQRVEYTTTATTTKYRLRKVRRRRVEFSGWLTGWQAGSPPTQLARCVHGKQPDLVLAVVVVVDLEVKKKFALSSRVEPSQLERQSGWWCSGSRRCVAGALVSCFYYLVPLIRRCSYHLSHSYSLSPALLFERDLLAPSATDFSCFFFINFFFFFSFFAEVVGRESSCSVSAAPVT